MMRTMHRSLCAHPLARIIPLLLLAGLLQACDNLPLHGAAGCGEKTYTADKAHHACIRTTGDGMAVVIDGAAGETYDHIEPHITFTAAGRAVYIATRDEQQLLVAGTHEGTERYDRLWGGAQPHGDIQRFLGLRGDTFYWVNLTVNRSSLGEELAFASRIPDGMRLDRSAASDPARFAFDPVKMQFAYPVFSRGGKKALIFRDGIDPFFDEVCCTQFSQDGETAAYIAMNKYKGQSAVVIRDERRRKIGNWFDIVGAPEIDAPVEGGVRYEAKGNGETEPRLYAEEL